MFQLAGLLQQLRKIKFQSLYRCIKRVRCVILCKHFLSIFSINCIFCNRQAMDQKRKGTSGKLMLLFNCASDYIFFPFLRPQEMKSCKMRSDRKEKARCRRQPSNQLQKFSTSCECSEKEVLASHLWWSKFRELAKDSFL